MKRLLATLTCLLLASPLQAADAVKEPINIDISTPPVVITRHAMAQRTSRLKRFYEAGEIGLGVDGLLYIHEGEKMKLVKRQIAEKLIDSENYERKALVYAIAESNRRPNEQEQVWVLMRKRWHEQWQSGWWLRDANGGWTRKP